MAAKVRLIKGVWCVVVHHQGQRRTKRVGRNKSVADRVAEQIQARLVLGQFDIEGDRETPVEFSNFADDWFRREILLPYELGEPGALAGKSVQAREQHIRLYLNPFFGDRDVRGIRVADIQALYEQCRENRRPASPNTLNTILGTLRRILATAQASELLGFNPVETWKAGRGRQRGGGIQPVDRSKVLTADDVTQLLDVSRREFSEHYPSVLFLADTGCRISELFALRWSDVDLEQGVARISSSIDFQGQRGPTKTGRSRVVELSTRLREILIAHCPDVFGDETLVFPSATGTPIEYQNYRSRVFKRIVRRAFGSGRRVTPHMLRHTFASLHLARGTNLKWVQETGGWTSAKMLLDVYGHYMPTESAGYADAITTSNGTQTAPPSRTRRDRPRRAAATTRNRRTEMEPTIRFERTTCSLRERAGRDRTGQVLARATGVKFYTPIAQPSGCSGSETAAATSTRTGSNAPFRDGFCIASMLCTRLNLVWIRTTIGR